MVLKFEKEGLLSFVRLKFERGFALLEFERGFCLVGLFEREFL